jgi:hypothetical protein
MRKVLVLLAMVVGASIAFFTAGTAAGAGDPNVYGVGGGWTGFAPGEHIAHYSFSAHEGPNGDFGQVHWNLQDPDFPLDITVDVDCVNAFPSLFGGSAAWIDGVVTKVSPQPNFAGLTVGSRVQFEAADGGEPSGVVPVDQFDAFGDQVGSCKDRPQFPLTPNVQQGNVVINMP